MRTMNRALTPLLLALPLIFVACSGDSPEKLLSSAKQHIAQKDAKAAVIQLKNVLQKSPSNAEARSLLGKLLLESGDVVGAEVELSKAMEQGGSADELAPLLAQAMLAQNKLEALISKFATIQLTKPSARSELQVQLAYAYAQLEKPTESRAALAKAFEAEPNSVPAQLLNIKLLMRQGEQEPIAKALENLLAQAPKTAEAWQLKGDYLFGTKGAGPEALEAYRHALQIDKQNLLSHVAVMWILLGSKDTAAAKAHLAELTSVLPNHPQTKFFVGLMALDAGDIKTAQEQAQFLLKVAPDNSRTLQLAGAVEFRKNSLAQAENYLTKFIKTAPVSMQGQSRLMLGQIYLRSGDPAKALTVLQPLLSGNARSAAAFALAAEAELQRGESKAAEAHFEHAVKLNPKDSRSRTALALAQLAKGEDRGFDELRAISSSENEITADMALVTVHVNREQWAKALAAIDAIEKKQAGQATAENLRGRVENARGDRQAARAAFERALIKDPKFFPAAASLAAYDLAEKKPELALKRFQTLLAADPKNVQAQLNVVELKGRAGASDAELVDALSKMVKDNPSELAPRLFLIRKQLDRGEKKLALAAAQEGATALPEQAEMLATLAQVQQANGQSNQAIATLNQWISLQTNAPLPYLKLAELYAADKDWAAASQNLKRALGVNEQFLPAQRLQTVVDLASGKPDSARQTAKLVQKQRPKEVVGLELEAQIEESQKNWGAAAAAYRAGLAKVPNTELAIKYHRVSLLDGKTAEADTFAAGWLKKYPADAAFSFYLGDLALAQNKFEVAEKYYQDVLKQQPENAAALNNLAWLFNRSNRAQALEFAEKAVRLQPKQPALLDTLAEIYATQGKYDLAIEKQKQALNLAPEVHQHRLHLAKYYLAAGKKSEAKAELKILTDLGDKFSSQDEVKKLSAGL